MSNLPPGVTDNMIPGNRPEDAEYESASEAFSEFLDKEAMVKLSDDAFELLFDWVWDMYQKRYSEGYQMGAAEALAAAADRTAVPHDQREPEPFNRG